MRFFSKTALNEGVTVRECFSWALFDAANSGYSTVVLTAVFNAYFVSVICADADWATLAWSTTVACANALSMLVMPVVGRMADLKAHKKRWLAIATLVCVVATALLAYAGPGAYVWAAVMVVVSSVGFNVGETLNSAFLPEIARRESLGKVSGWGWSLGYIGGLATLAVCLAVVLAGRSRGAGEETLVGASCIITAVIFAVLAVPAIVFLKERSPAVNPDASWRQAWRESVDELKRTAALLGTYKDFARLVVCGFLYQCGIATVITLAAVYASAVMGFGLVESLVLVLVVNVTAAVGAFGFGYVEDWLGHKLALAATLFIWIAMVACAASAQSVALFWVAANLAGLAMGSSQSAGRAMVAVLAPAGRLAQFYSFWNMALWLSVIVGPVTYGAVTWATGNNQRLAIIVVGFFFVFGLLALIPVNLKRGAQLAKSAVLDADGFGQGEGSNAKRSESGGAPR